MQRIHRQQPGRPKSASRCSPLIVVGVVSVVIYATFLWYWFVYRPASLAQHEQTGAVGLSQLALKSDDPRAQLVPSLRLPSTQRNVSLLNPSVVADQLHNPTQVSTVVHDLVVTPLQTTLSPPSMPTARVTIPVAVSPAPEHADIQQQKSLASGLHIFYYGWYGTPEQDGKWLHWDHQVLPHWTSSVNARYPQIGSKHKPPQDIGSNYYPLLGPYSSSDPKVIRAHLDQIAGAGIGVLVYSWWGRGTGDANGASTDENIIAQVMKECRRTGVKIAFHLEPYEGRTALTVKEDAEHLLRRYGNDPALYRLSTRHGRKTVFYVYDSYHISPQSWSKVLKRSSWGESIRGKPGDAIFLGLWVEEHHGKDLVTAGFDGFYTYFASKGFTYGSTYRNWERMAAFAQAHNMMFVPSIGPGYIDTAIRPWNAQNQRDRLGGEYFKEAWTAADRYETEILSLTSFNEWHEGTQFEPIQKWPGAMDYGNDDGTLYLDMVRRRTEQCTTFQRRSWCGPTGNAKA